MTTNKWTVCAMCNGDVPRAFSHWSSDGWTCVAAEPNTGTPISPTHYTRLNPEPIDVIDAWNLGFYESQVIKYLARAGQKGGEGKRLEDLEKAAFYLSRRIANLRKGKT